MLDRRTLFGTTAVVSSVIASLFGRGKAEAKLPESKDLKAVDFEPRGKIGRLERIPRLDLESHDDFLTSFRTFVNGDLTRLASKRAHDILEEKGLDPRAPMDRKEALDLLSKDPVIATRFRAWTSTQKMTWKNFVDEFHANGDKYLAEMEATDNAGPGTLELNPGIEPEYTKHEVHMQPGGYVGDPFAGHIYHYGTNNFHMGRNDQDEAKRRMARAVPMPEDSQVNRVLEQGCSIGQTTMGLKERFPNAEVWGIDVGGPMVRYGHMRAVDLGVDINLAQRLAEDSKFQDGYFDIVMSNILHHEVTLEVSKKIVREAFRVLRPGGVYYPVDFYTGGMGGGMSKPSTGWEQVRWWWTHRWNQEPWYYEYVELDFPGEMEKAGFQVSEGPNSSRRPGGNIMGTKPA